MWDNETETGFSRYIDKMVRGQNLKAFRNLEVIGGKHLTEYFSALYIVKTSLESLNLKSLNKIRSGSVAILENNDLWEHQLAEDHEVPEPQHAAAEQQGPRDLLRGEARAVQWAVSVPDYN